MSDTAGLSHGTGVRARLAGLLRWTRPWYSAYGLIGLVLLGVGPILVPLTVDPRGPAAVGLVVAFFYVGALFSPVVGWFADRSGTQRRWFLACFPAMSVTLVLFAYAGSVWAWSLLAMVFGGAGAVGGTLSSTFVVEASPEAEWNQRISWLRLAYGVGQVVGLLVAAVCATRLDLGWWVAGIAVLPGVLLGRWGLPHLRARGSAAPKQAPASASWRPPPGGHGVPRMVQELRWSTLRRELHGPYVRFLVTWTITMIGVQTFFNVVPLVMRDGFGVSPSASSVLFMVGAAAGSLLFPALAGLADRIGAGRVLGVGMLISLTCFGAMFTAHALGVAGMAAVGSVALVVAAVAYSFEVVGATMLVARLSPSSEGAAMGMMNSAIAAGAIIGAIAPSAVAAAFGYASLTLVAAAVLVVALVVGAPLVLRGRTS